MAARHMLILCFCVYVVSFSGCNAVNNGVTLQATPPTLYAGLSVPLTLDCALHKDQVKNLGSLLSIILLKAAEVDIYNEICSVSTYVMDQVKVANASTKGTGTGHIDTVTDSSLKWTFPGAATGLSGRYRCQMFGMDITGHPLTIISEVDVGEKALDIEAAQGRIRDLQVLQEECKGLKENHTAVLAGHQAEIDSIKDQHKDEMKNLTAQQAKQLSILDKLREDTFAAVSEEYEGHQYYLARHQAGSIALSAARFVCQRWRGYLVEINDQKEYDFVMKFLQNNATDPKTVKVLTGATDEGHEGHWVFLETGENVPFIKWVSTDYSHGNNYNCLYLEHWNENNIGMDDEYCSQARDFMCEIP